MYNNFYTGDQQVVTNSVTVQTRNANPTYIFNSNGESYLTTHLTHVKQWQGLNIVKNKDITAMINVGNNKYVCQNCTNLKYLVVINYIANYGVNTYNFKGKELQETHLRCKGGTRWQNNNKLIDIPKAGLCYQFSTNEFIHVKYQVGYQG